MASSYSMTSKTQTEAKQAEEKRVVERRRAALVLCIRHLVDHGYIEAAEKLQSESRISLQEHDAADNVDLLAIIQEYEFFFEMKFGKKPKLTKKTTADSATLPKLPPSGRSAAAAAAAAAGGGSKQRRAVDDSSGDEKNPKSSLSTGLAGLGASRAAASAGAAGEGGDGFGLVGTALKGNAVGAAKKSSDDPNDFFKERLLKPLPDFGGNSELRELAGSLQRDIWTSNPDVRWSDVAAADNAKRLLKEAVVMPSRYPQLFTGLLKPWKGVLLFGPPGTGKTMLAKAVATECRTTFFNISASSIVSKWRGDSEKLVRALFELARHHAPSTIFVDEIDSIMSSRDGGGQEHEGSRRMKTELLIQMDGLTASNDQVFLLAASNLPWDLDTALLRRLEKRIYVGLPPTSARLLIMNKHLHDRVEKGYSLESMAAATEGYSGSDVVLLCKEAAMRPLRRLMKRIEDNEALGALTGEVVLEPISSSDMEQAVRASRPSCRVDESQYLKWHDDFGAAM